MVSKLFVESRQCDNLYIRVVLRSVMVPQLRITYPIDEVNESLSFSAPKASCNRNTVLGMHDDRHGLYRRNICRVGDVVE